MRDFKVDESAMKPSKLTSQRERDEHTHIQKKSMESNALVRRYGIHFTKNFSLQSENKQNIYFKNAQPCNDDIHTYSIEVRFLSCISFVNLYANLSTMI